MKLLIGIATYKRLEKLKRCLRSIENSSYKDIVKVVVVEDDGDETFRTWLHSGESDFDLPIWDLVQYRRSFVIGAWNRVVQENITNKWDGFIGLCDDVELHPDALKEAVFCHMNSFSDTDGVVGFRQEIPGFGSTEGETFKWFGQTLMGREFVKRYKEGNYQICCPEYSHFCQDEEMWEYAKSLNKFVNCEKALLYHYHPSFIKSELDETHGIIRNGDSSPRKIDFEIQRQRREKGYLWGKNFNLIKEMK